MDSGLVSWTNLLGINLGASFLPSHRSLLYSELGTEPHVCFPFCVSSSLNWRSYFGASLFFFILLRVLFLKQNYPSHLGIFPSSASVGREVGLGGWETPPWGPMLLGHPWLALFIPVARLIFSVCSVMGKSWESLIFMYLYFSFLSSSPNSTFGVFSFKSKFILFYLYCSWPSPRVQQPILGLLQATSNFTQGTHTPECTVDTAARWLFLKHPLVI